VRRTNVPPIHGNQLKIVDLGSQGAQTSALLPTQPELTCGIIPYFLDEENRFNAKIQALFNTNGGNIDRESGYFKCSIL
jgi:hypothetical protein